MKRQRTGLSEVIAALLILVISVTIGTIFFAWGTSALNLTQSGFIQQTALSRDKIEERITVTSIYYNSSNQTLYIGVFNYGRRAATIDAVYVNLTAYAYGVGTDEFSVCDPDDAEKTACSAPSDGNVIQVGELVWIRFTDLILAEDKFVAITLATERGNSYELLFEA